MIGDAKQHVSGHGPHALKDISLQHDSITRSGPGDGRWDLPCTLDLGKNLWRHGVVQQALGRARRGRRRKILCASGGDCRTVETEQGLALAHLASRRHVLNQFVHGRAIRAGSQSSVRRGRAHASIHAATVAGTAGVRHHRESGRVGDAQMEGPIRPQLATSSGGTPVTAAIPLR